MKTSKIWKGFLLLFIVALLILSPIPSKVFASSDIQKVYDNASLLSKDENKKLTKILNMYSKKNNADIMVITTETLSDQSRVDYLKDFHSKVKNHGNKNNNFVFLLLNIDPNDRGVELLSFSPTEGEGKSCRYYLNTERVNVILDKIIPMFKSSNYYDAFASYANQIDHYIGYEYEIYYRLWFQMLVSLGIGAIVVFIMAKNSGGKITVNNTTYLDKENSEILENWDNYINTTITRVPKPKDNNNNNSDSGDSGTSGGSSYSGDGRNF